MSEQAHGHAPKGPVALLALGALGIVYGDIGTSPLYAFRETFHGHGHELAVTETNVLGLLSLVFWSLVVVISIKYLLFVMKADNNGEGGILALVALCRGEGQSKSRRNTLILLGVFGTALLYGDAAITPAISVLSAVEGAEIAAPGLSDWVVRISCGILWPRPLPSSPRRRSSQECSRSPSRPSSWAMRPATGSGTRRPRRWARSISRRSTGH